MNTEKAKELVALLAQECTSMSDVQAMLKNLFKSTIEQMLEAEMEEHLGYEKHSILGNNSGNSRNGYGKKTLKKPNCPIPDSPDTHELGVITMWRR